MKFFDTGQRAMGFIAIGQEATGFFALGQMATGVIAIGQVARGCIAIGQGAIGLIGWGQGGVGVFHAVGMIGIGGRGFGPVLRLIPSIGRPRILPPATTLAAVKEGEAGWVEADLNVDLGLYQAGARLPVKLDRRLQNGAKTAIAEGAHRVLAHVRPVAMGGGPPYPPAQPVGTLLVCERIAYEPPRPYQKKGFWVLGAFQLAGLLCLATAWVAFVGHDLWTTLAPNEASAPKTAPHPAARPARGRSR
jgi:hypothetical protein